MVHLIHNNKPICEKLHIKCEYPTRSMAFDAAQQRHLSPEVKIVVGRCPHLNCSQEASS